MDEKKDLCSITGLFIQDHSPNIVHYFGGLIFLDKTEWLEESFTGLLIDHFGHSSINGTISPHELKFNKEYIQKQNVITYEFEKNKEGIWQGVYSSLNERIGGGRALCKINLDWKNINLTRQEYVNPETWAKEMIKGMITEGMIRIEKDPKTGEDMIIPEKIDKKKN